MSELLSQIKGRNGCSVGQPPDEIPLLALAVFCETSILIFFWQLVHLIWGHFNVKCINSFCSKDLMMRKRQDCILQVVNIWKIKNISNLRTLWVKMFFRDMSSEKMRNKVPKLKEEWLRLEIRRNFSTKKRVSRLPKENVQSPSLEVFKIWTDKPWTTWSDLMSDSDWDWHWASLPPEVPSSYSVI